jgi:hypothetical protein
MAGVSMQEVPDAVVAHGIGGIAGSVDEGGIIHVPRHHYHHVAWPCQACHRPLNAHRFDV